MHTGLAGAVILIWNDVLSIGAELLPLVSNSQIHF